MEINQETIEALINLLRLCRNASWTDDEDVRSRLIESALGASPELIAQSSELRRELISTCQALLKADDWQTAETAAEKLGVLRASEAIPDLILVSKGHEDTKVRLTAIESLGKVGAFSTPAKQVLSALSHDANQSISGTAEDALSEIQKAEKATGGRPSLPFDPNLPPDAEGFFDFYSRAEFSSDEHRLAYLETCLKYLASVLSWEEIQSFPWPTTFAPASKQDGSVLATDFEPVGMLSHFGYRVGKGGVTESTRKKLLEKVFTQSTLPHVNSAAYVQEWGRADTAKRLRKMAESIAAFCRNAKRRSSADMADSIDGWEADLAWLKKRFYDDRFDFPWPRTGK